MAESSSIRQCVILAGGLGTRMKPITERVPKSLIPALDRPFVDYQFGYLKRFGIDRVVLCIGHMGSMIRDFVGDGSRWGLQVQYVDEGEKLRGTGGALGLALEQGALDPVFFLTYGDSFLPIDFAAVAARFEASGKPALMTVLRNRGRWDRSNVVIGDNEQGLSVALYDKARHTPEMDAIDYGLSVLKRDVIGRLIPRQTKADLAEVFHRLSIEGSLAAMEVVERFYEIGSPQGLADFESYLSNLKDPAAGRH